MSSKSQAESPTTRQANPGSVHRTIGVHIRQSVPLWHRPTHDVNFVAIHNNVNHLPWNNIALFVNP